MAPHRKSLALIPSRAQLRAWNEDSLSSVLENDREEPKFHCDRGRIVFDIVERGGRYGILPVD